MALTVVAGWGLVEAGHSGGVGGVRVRSVDGGEVGQLCALARRAGVSYAPGGDVFLAAVVDGRLVGWLSGTLTAIYPGPGAPVRPPHGYVQAVVVDPNHRRVGIGRRLVEEFVSAAGRAGVGWVFAAPDEDAGIEQRVEWLAACGFRPVVDPGERWPVMGRHPV
ncbi:GNAT family N-acetyltransferase [Nocardiopsis sp. NPDC006938]|uniref:GNAT family N-acetyltransferase n=1 Tax=Nocardiopsis sp. NPDC006938 TaxID=3364337 RepID=UPI0036AEF3A1